MVCKHEDVQKIGQMEETPIEGVYVIPMTCLDCDKDVFEKYYYEGIIEDKDDPE